MTLIDDAGGHFAESSLLRRADYQDRGLAFSAESTSSLAPSVWTARSLTTIGTPVPVGDGSHERVKVRVNPPLNGQARMFFRLRANLGTN